VRLYAEQGEHVHQVGGELNICYNGTHECDSFVRQRFQWDGSEMVLLSGEVQGEVVG
jgi:hypothetical protein